MFNDYMWQTYLNAGGRAVAEMFERNLNGEFSEEYADNIKNLHKAYCPSGEISDIMRNELLDLFDTVNNGEYLLEDGEYSIETAMEYFAGRIKGDDNISFQRVFDVFSGSVAFFTTYLAVEIPTLFVPYYFCYNFNILEKIAQEFEIELPPIPIKKDYEGRFFYYGEICGALFDFREKHNMSPYELCAFLYDFAPKYVGGIDSYIIKDLPEPKSAFFIGGSKDDIFLEENADIVTCWQCNPDTRAGDMIVMYLRTPISAVDSVWRSVSIGFNDPFFYYYRCTYIANPVGVKRISQKQLQCDEIFKDLPIVRKNMQGINGVELLPSQYNHLMDIAEANAPRLEFIVSDSNHTFNREKDVEDKLIKPLLEKLDYSQEEYVQQLYIEIGNHNHALIPDFVLLPVKERGHQSAFALIEAKLSIPNKKEMEEVRIQARSYAVQLKARYSVIADKNKIWISACNDDFTEDIFVSTWDELNNPDTFSKLYKLIGRKSVK